MLNILIIGVGFINFLCVQGVTLSLKVFDQEKQPVQQVDMTNPFIVEVAVDEDISEKPLIENLEHIEVLEESSTMTVSLIGSTKKSVKRFIYKMRALKPGSLVIGPAFIKSKNLQSNSIQITVSASPVYTSQSLQLELIINKSTVFVGEKVPYAIRLLYLENEKVPFVHAIDQIHHENITIENTQGPFRITYEKEGKKYSALEWRASFIPNVAGLLSIPGVKAVIENKKKEESFFTVFFGNAVRTLISNPLRLEVQALPPYNQPVTAVGEFNNFQVSVDKNQVKQHEGVSLLLKVQGRGNIQAIEAPSLQIPSTFKEYPSSQSVENYKEYDEKKFEYIIQPTKAGLWEIPAQTFIYFSPQDKAYKTLHTQPFTIHVIANDLSSPVVLEPSHKKEDKEIATTALEQQKDPLLITVPWIRTIAIPYTLFIILLGIPLFLLGSYYGISTIHKYYKSHTRVRCTALFSQARKKLKKSKPLPHPLVIYEVFKELFQNLYKAQLINFEDISEVNLLSTEQLNKEWKHYWEGIVQSTFDGFPDNRNFAAPLEQAFQWLNLFEHVIKKNIQ